MKQVTVVFEFMVLNGERLHVPFLSRHCGCVSIQAAGMHTVLLDKVSNQFKLKSKTKFFYIGPLV